MPRPSTPELARRIVDRVVKVFEENEVLDPVWHSEYGNALDVKHELITEIEKELEGR